MPPAVKICGLSSAEPLAAAVAGGARYVGFVFYTPSPRHIAPSAAAALAKAVPVHVGRVGVTVDADDALLDEIVETSGVGILQLHGEETPGRVAAVRRRYGLPVIKAIPTAVPADVETARRFEGVADILMFDAKAPANVPPGGNAHAFDWSLLAGREWRVPWFLSGGLTARNLAQAVRETGAALVDVSSGVESSRGVKSAELVASFLGAAQALS